MTTVTGGDETLFAVNQPRRQMLSRVGDAMYWLSRYMERAEHLARLLHENLQLLTDVGELAPRVKHELWLGILRVFGLEQAPAAMAICEAGDVEIAGRMSAYMTFDITNTNSLLTCITNARENARSIRENISAEIWEDLNTLYWSLQGAEARGRFDESPLELYRQVMNGSMLFQGLTDQTLARAQGWLFMQLGKGFERVDITCRIMEVRFEMLQAAEASLDAAERNIHWMSVLRSCGSLEGYRRVHLGEMDAMRVAAFLVLSDNFPRSIRACVRSAYEAVSQIRSEINPHSADAAERILGRLNTQLEYAEGGEILGGGVPAYMKKIRLEMAQAAEGMRKTYFLH
jgi:uncharacterized alpha-E superfamily protein